MHADSRQAQASDKFTAPLLEKLRRHPKRIVFTEGEDPRILEVARRFVRDEAGVPVLLGSPERIRAMAAERDLPLAVVQGRPVHGAGRGFMVPGL